MNINTFYNLFYRHRFEKASLIRKMYLVLILPFKYLYNYFHLDKKKKFVGIGMFDPIFFLLGRC